MTFHIFVSFLISFYLTFVAGSESPCCTMDICAIEKIDLVSQLMALATQVQNSAKSRSCVPTQLQSSTTTITTPTTTPTTTTEPTTTMRQWRYGLYMTGANQQEASSDCTGRGLELIRFEKPEEMEEFREYASMHYKGWSDVPNTNHYFWTSGVKDAVSVWRWGIGGEAIDPAIVAKIIVPTGQESAINLILTYHPLAIKLTQYDGTRSLFAQTFAIHNICEIN